MNISEPLASIRSLSWRLLLWQVWISGPWEQRIISFLESSVEIPSTFACLLCMGSATTFVLQVFLKLRSQVSTFPCTRVMGLSLSGRREGVGIPGAGKRVTRIPKHRVTWRGAGKLGGLELKAKDEAREETEFGSCSSIIGRTSRSLPSLFPICLLSRCCLSKVIE